MDKRTLAYTSAMGFVDGVKEPYLRKMVCIVCDDFYFG